MQTIDAQTLTRVVGGITYGDSKQHDEEWRKQAVEEWRAASSIADAEKRKQEQAAAVNRYLDKVWSGRDWGW